MQKRIVLSLGVSALLAISGLVPAIASASSNDPHYQKLAVSNLGQQIREKINKKIDGKKEEICERFSNKIQSRFPWVKGPSFCRGGGGGGGGNNLPDVSISADPMMVSAGATTTIGWDSVNANSCTASNGWSGSKALSGTQIVTVNATTTYTLSCANGNGTTTESVTVGIIPPTPITTLTFNGSPLTVEVGATSTLTWSSNNATACTASNGWSGSKSLSGNQIVALSATTTYTLACGNGMATDTKSVTVNVTPAPQPPTPTLTFNGNSLTINQGATSTLTWVSGNTTSCTASGGWSGARALSGNEIVSPNATTTYVLSCSGSGGIIFGTTTINVIPAPSPNLTFNGSPLQIIAGATSTLTWTSANTVSCTASNGWSGAKSTGGNEIVSPLATTTYVLSCSGLGGTASSSVTIGVTPTSTPPAPALTFNGNLLSVQTGATSTLTWNATNANACVASDGWSGGKALSGNEIVTLSATTTYTLACGNGTATDTKSVTVNVTPAPPEPTLIFSGNPLAIIAGATSTLAWSTTNANTCTASNGWSGAKTISGSDIVSPNSTTTYHLSCSGAGGATSSDVTIGVTPTSFPLQTIGHMVISEVYYDTSTSTGETEPANEWFELFNASNSAIDINGWKVQDESGSFDIIATSSTIIPSGTRVVVTDSTTTPSFWSIPSIIIFLNSAIGNALGNTVDSLVLMDGASTTIDAVSWGTATTTTVMVPTVPGVAAGHSIGRIQFTADTNTNADWGNITTPTPGL